MGASKMLNKRVATLPLCAVACYSARSGALLGVLRLRLIEALPQDVGRHAAPFEGDAAGFSSGHRADIQWRPRTDGPLHDTEVLASTFRALQETRGGADLLDGLAAGLRPEGIHPALEVIVFLECYPWERPRTLLASALEAHAFHGKSIRSDLLPFLDRTPALSRAS